MGFAHYGLVEVLNDARGKEASTGCESMNSIVLEAKAIALMGGHVTETTFHRGRMSIRKVKTSFQIRS
jgi:hypothetical protein